MQRIQQTRKNMNIALAAISFALLVTSHDSYALDRPTPQRSSTSNVTIPDYSNGNPGYANKSFTLSGFPSTKKVTKLVVEWGFSHDRRQDVVIALSTDTNSRG